MASQPQRQHFAPDPLCRATAFKRFSRPPRTSAPPAAVQPGGSAAPNRGPIASVPLFPASPRKAAFSLSPAAATPALRRAPAPGPARRLPSAPRRGGGGAGAGPAAEPRPHAGGRRWRRRAPGQPLAQHFRVGGGAERSGARRWARDVAGVLRGRSAPVIVLAARSSRRRVCLPRRLGERREGSQRPSEPAGGGRSERASGCPRRRPAGAGCRPAAVNRLHLSAARALTAGAGAERGRQEGASGRGGEPGSGRPWPTRISSSISSSGTQVSGGGGEARRGGLGRAGGGRAERSGEQGPAPRSHFRSAGVVDVVALREEAAPPPPPPLRLCAGPRPGPRPASRRLRARRPWAPPPGPEA